MNYDCCWQAVSSTSFKAPSNYRGFFYFCRCVCADAHPFAKCAKRMGHPATSTSLVGYRPLVGSLTGWFNQPRVYCLFYCCTITAHEYFRRRGIRLVPSIGLFDAFSIEINSLFNGDAIIHSKISYEFLCKFPDYAMPPRLPYHSLLHPRMLTLALVDLLPKHVLNVCLGRCFHFEILFENRTLAG